jgi:hypothetical protein
VYISSQLLTPWPNFSRQQRRHSPSSLLFAELLAKMATSTSFSYASALRGSAGRDGGSKRPPVQVPPLHHVPAFSANLVFIDLRVVKPSVTTEERNDFLLEDLRVSVDEVSEIWPEPESQLLRLAFFTADQHKRYLDRLTAGVPWSACRGALVYGWSPGDTITAVRLTGVPASLPDAAIREHFSQFGRVTRVFRSKDKVFTRVSPTSPSPSPPGSPCPPLSRWSMQMAAQTRECWSTQTPPAAAAPDAEQRAMLPSSAGPAAASPAPTLPSGVSSAYRQTSFPPPRLPWTLFQPGRPPKPPPPPPSVGGS